MIECRIVLSTVFAFWLVGPTSFADGGDAAKHPNRLDLAAYDGVIRIACVGDGLTWGAGLRRREHEHYPAFLERCLGDRFRVTNLADPTAFAKRPLSLPSAVSESLRQWKPNVVLLMVGTALSAQNDDSEPATGDGLAAELGGIVQALKTGRPDLRVYLCLPPPMDSNRHPERARRLDDWILPEIRAAATRQGRSLLDVFQAMKSRPEAFPDGRYPNAYGAALIGQFLCYELVDR